MARLEIRDLVFRYEEMIMRFDLDLASGRICALIGPSGAGKSSLLALIAGFENPESGTIHVDGLDILALPPAARPVTSLFQDHNLFAHLNVADNIGLGLRPDLRLSRADRQAIGAALDEVGLAGFERRLPGQLSGGERQRVALARCLMRRRPILLLDEPFAALGPGQRRDMLNLVRQLRDRQSLGILMVTHDPEDARLIADEAAFVAAGRILRQGPVAAVLADPDTAIRGYLGD